MSSPGKPTRRPWWRLLTQFSLRSLLVLTTLAAVGCWWFLRPESHDEALAGGHLKLRRQVRMDRNMQGLEEYPMLRSIGAWRVRDGYGDLLIDGQYKDDLPHGRWTIYYPNGRKAADGQVFSGARTGLWRAWDEQGTLRSEATYKAVLRTERQLPPIWPFNHPVVPVVGMIDLLGQLGGGGMMGGGLGGGPVTAPLPVFESKYVAVRHGPAKAWYAGGQLQWEGSYRDDLRDGLWTRYDEQGQIVEQGAYSAGARDGIWTVRSPDEERSHERRYAAGLTADQQSELVARLAGDLAAGNINRKIGAAERLEKLGPAGVQVLVIALETGDLETQLLALRALSRLESISDDTLAKIEPRVDDPDPRIALRARLAIYRAQPGERGRLLAPLLAAAQDAEDALAMETLLEIYRADPERRLRVLAPLVERMAPPEFEFRGSWTHAPPRYIEQLAALGWDVVPHLDAIYSSASPEGRWFMVRVLHELVNRSQSAEIPDSGRSLLGRAQADADPRVRAAAELVGQPRGGPGPRGGGFF
jgi:antitoxin component YwqK of YwqJK toxin-antitoxin module